MTYPYIWRVRLINGGFMNPALANRFGQRLAVLARGRMNSCHVRFEEDGFEAITSRNYMRKAAA